MIQRLLKSQTQHGLQKLLMGFCRALLTGICRGSLTPLGSARQRSRPFLLPSIAGARRDHRVTGSGGVTLPASPFVLPTYPRTTLPVALIRRTYVAVNIQTPDDNFCSTFSSRFLYSHFIPCTFFLRPLGSVREKHRSHFNCLA